MAGVGALSALKVLCENLLKVSMELLSALVFGEVLLVVLN